MKLLIALFLDLFKREEKLTNLVQLTRCCGKLQYDVCEDCGNDLED